MSISNTTLIHEDASRVCGSIIVAEDIFVNGLFQTVDNEYIIAGIIDDVCLRDFIICIVHRKYPRTPEDDRSIFAYIGRPGVSKNRMYRSIGAMIQVLEKAGDRSHHFPELLFYGNLPHLIFGINDDQAPEYDPAFERPLVMTKHRHSLISLLPSLSTNGCVPVQLALHIGLGMVRALASLHRLGFVHRLVMPHSFAYPTGCNLKQLKDGIMIVDFSLCMPWPSEPRAYVPFVGTLRYSSLRAHNHQEQSHSDDIISVIYTMAELISGQLPWSFVPPSEENRIVELKKEFWKHDAFKRLPREIRHLYGDMMMTTKYVLNHHQLLTYFEYAIHRRDPKNEYKIPSWLESPTSG